MSYQTRTTLYDVHRAHNDLRRTLDNAGLLKHPTYGEIRTDYREGRPRWNTSFAMTFDRRMTEAEVAAITEPNGRVITTGIHTIRHTYVQNATGNWDTVQQYWVRVSPAEIHRGLADIADLTPSRGEAKRKLVAARQRIEAVTNAKTEGAVQALNTVAGLLLDQVGIVTYETMVADGMERTEALRTAILLGRMEG